jgi:hypothetical protein
MLANRSLEDKSGFQNVTGMRVSDFELLMTIIVFKVSRQDTS